MSFSLEEVQKKFQKVFPGADVYVQVSSVSDTGEIKVTKNIGGLRITVTETLSARLSEFSTDTKFLAHVAERLRSKLTNAIGEAVIDGRILQERVYYTPSSTISSPDSFERTEADDFRIEPSKLNKDLPSSPEAGSW